MRPLQHLPCPAGFTWSPQALADDEVHLWQLDPAQAQRHVNALCQLVAPDELDRADRFRQLQDRQRYVVTRGVLRLLIEAYGVAPAAEIRFTYSAQGKPRLAEGHRADWLQFNLSHTRGKSVLAFARAHAVGVDVERYIELGDRDELAESCFSARELEEYRALDAEDGLRGFYNGWTRKEAFIKATGEGLQRPLDSFSVSVAPGEEPRLLEVDGDRQVAASWTMHDLTERDPGGAFILALAIRAPQARVTCRHWESLT